MADQQHLATADHWALVGRMRHHAEFSCLLELLHRVEALEAAKSGSIDLSHLSDAERGKILKLLANPDRFEVLEVAQPAKPSYPALCTPRRPPPEASDADQHCATDARHNRARCSLPA